MSAAAIAPKQPYVSEADRNDPLFPEYNRYRSSMSVLLVEASSFKNWKSQREHQATGDAAARHPRYPDFLEWMRATKAGARHCSAGNSFPANFRFWLDGGRW